MVAIRPSLFLCLAFLDLLSLVLSRLQCLLACFLYSIDSSILSLPFGGILDAVKHVSKLCLRTQLDAQTHSYDRDDSSHASSGFWFCCGAG